MVDRSCGTPGGRRVTGFTQVRGQCMCRPLTRRINAVVTAETIVGDIGVIEVRRYPGHRRMAIIAVVTARDMPRVLAVSDRTVMAGDAGTEYLGVVDTIGRFPENVVMAVLAHICR